MMLVVGIGLIMSKLFLNNEVVTLLWAPLDRPDQLKCPEPQYRPDSGRLTFTIS